MSLPEAIREQVRVRAAFACEFCGVTETDAGGLLTIDHFQPSTLGGTDTLDNLLYCCPRCNQYKADYWPQSEQELQLWHPRKAPPSAHFVELTEWDAPPLNEHRRVHLASIASESSAPDFASIAPSNSGRTSSVANPSS